MSKTRSEVRKSDMNILVNPAVTFVYAGLFESKTPWSHPDRIESTYELIYMTRGEAYMREGEEDLRLTAGQAAILLPGVRHYGTQITEDVGFYWVHFYVTEGELPFKKRFFSCFETPSLFSELLHYNNLPAIPEYMVNVSLVRILAELCRLSEAADSEEVGDRAAERIYEWIRTRASASLTVEKTAARFGFSADHVTRIVKRKYGVGAGELIDRFIMNEAKSLLCGTDKYVKEIAAELNFSGDKAFIGYFKYHEGISPTTFRKRFCKLHMNSK